MRQHEPENGWSEQTWPPYTNSLLQGSYPSSCRRLGAALLKEAALSMSGNCARRAAGAFSVAPEALEAIRCERRVAHRRGDRAMAEVVLDRPGVLTVVRQLVAAGMAKHVAVDEERGPS